MDPTLANAIYGVVALRDATTTSGPDYVNSCITFAEQDILARLEDVTTSRLQALLLVTRYYMETGRLQKAFMLIAIAARFATVMRLNHETCGLSSVQAEVRRRIVWSLKLMERYFSIGLLEFELCPFEVIYLQFPAHEETFLDPRSHSASDDSQATCYDRGAYRLAVKLEVIRRDIMKFSRCISLGDGGLDLFLTLFRSFADELAQVSLRMAPLTISSSTLEERIGDPWLPRRIFLQLSYHQCYCDLWRLMLTGYREAAPLEILRQVEQEQVASAEQHCLENAMAIVRIVTTLNDQSMISLLLEFDTAICAYHAIRLLLFIASNGTSPNRPSLEFAVSRANLCIASLKRFFPRSPLVEPIISELETLATPDASVGNVSGGRQQSPYDEADTEPAFRISSTAKAKQRLAIHSLLSRVQFDSDGAVARDDDEAASAATAPGLFDERSTISASADENSRAKYASGNPSNVHSNAAGIFDPPTYGSDSSSPTHTGQVQFPVFPWLTQ